MRLRWTNRVVLIVLLIGLLGCHGRSELDANKSENETLLTAARRGDLPQVQKLLRDGSDPNEHTAGGKTALHYAAQSKNASVVQVLIQAGANVNAEATGNVTPLMLSVDMAFG